MDHEVITAIFHFTSEHQFSLKKLVFRVELETCNAFEGSVHLASTTARSKSDRNCVMGRALIPRIHLDSSDYNPAHCDEHSDHLSSSHLLHSLAPNQRSEQMFCVLSYSKADVAASTGNRMPQLSE